LLFTCPRRGRTASRAQRPTTSSPSPPHPHTPTPTAQAFPLYRATADTEGIFKPLFMLVALFLVCVRINLAWDIRSGDRQRVFSSARVNAMVHVAEAVYYTGTVFGEHGALAASPFNFARDIRPAVIFAIIIINAAIFTVFAVNAWKESNEEEGGEGGAAAAAAAAAVIPARGGAPASRRRGAQGAGEDENKKGK
jgi:hypothetical protein